MQWRPGVEVIKAPSAVVDVLFDFQALTNGRGLSDWLSAGETIVSQTTTAEAGLTVNSSSLTDSATSVTVWLSGGTLGVLYAVTCRVTTSAGRTDERTIKVRIANR